MEWNNYFLYLQSTLCVGLALKDVNLWFSCWSVLSRSPWRVVIPYFLLYWSLSCLLRSPSFFISIGAHLIATILDETWVHSTYNCTSASHFHFLVRICWDRGIVLFLIHNSLFEMVFVQKRIRCLSCLRWPSSLSKIQNLRRNQHIILKDLNF